MNNEYWYKAYCPICHIEWVRKIYDTLDPPEKFGDACPHCNHHLMFHKEEEKE